MSSKSMLRGLWLAIGLSLAGVVPAAANPVTWSLFGVTLEDGGMATGTFRYDADTNTFDNINIVTSGGGQPGAVYTQVGGVYGGAGLPVAADRLGVLTLSGAGVGQRNLNLQLVSGMTNAGGMILVRPTSAFSAEVTCANAPCSLAGAPLRGTSGGAVTSFPLPPPTIPTMSEWAMILFGVLLAGLAGFSVTRRYPA